MYKHNQNQLSFFLTLQFRWGYEKMVMYLLKTKISLLNNVSSTLKDESKNLVLPMDKSSEDDKQVICGQSPYWY